LSSTGIYFRKKDAAAGQVVALCWKALTNVAWAKPIPPHSAG